MVEFGQVSLHVVQAGAEVGQIGGVLLLSFAELQSHARQQRLGAPPLALRVAHRLLRELDAVLRLLRSPIIITDQYKEQQMMIGRI